MKLIIALMLGLLIAGLIERALHERNLRRVPLRVLVNGTRGKTSVTRLMAAVLREAGYRAFAKCTGSAAATILPDGSEQPTLRRRGARLTEQLPFFRRAVKARADAAVVECMAVRPESQHMMAGLTRPTLTLLTNARVDHVAEIGASEGETLRALAFSVPEGAKVITSESGLARFVDSPIDCSHEPVDDAYIAEFTYPVFKDNLQLVLAAAAYLGIDRAVAMRGMLRAKPDIGMAGPFKIGECVVINAFAANDIESSELLLEQTQQQLGIGALPVRMVFNHRGDREYRLSLFLPLLRALSIRATQLCAIGDHAHKVARYFEKRTGIHCVTGSPEALLEAPGIVLCLGNIKNEGVRFIQYCIEREGA